MLHSDEKNFEIPAFKKVHVFVENVFKFPIDKKGFLCSSLKFYSVLVTSFSFCHRTVEEPLVFSIMTFFTCCFSVLLSTDSEIFCGKAGLRCRTAPIFQ